MILQSRSSRARYFLPGQSEDSRSNLLPTNKEQRATRMMTCRKHNFSYDARLLARVEYKGTKISSHPLISIITSISEVPNLLAIILPQMQPAYFQVLPTEILQRDPHRNAVRRRYGHSRINTGYTAAQHWYSSCFEAEARRAQRAGLSTRDS